MAKAATAVKSGTNKGGPKKIRKTDDEFLEAFFNTTPRTTRAICERLGVQPASVYNRLKKFKKYGLLTDADVPEVVRAMTEQRKQDLAEKIAKYKAAMALKKKAG